MLEYESRVLLYTKTCETAQKQHYFTLPSLWANWNMCNNICKFSFYSLLFHVSYIIFLPQFTQLIYIYHWAGERGRIKGEGKERSRERAGTWASLRQPIVLIILPWFFSLFLLCKIYLTPCHVGNDANRCMSSLGQSWLHHIKEII